MSTTLPFAGEAFLEDPLPPDVTEERFWLVICLGILLVSLLIIAPAVLGKLYSASSQQDDEDKESPGALKLLHRLNLIGVLLAAYWILGTSNNFYSARSVFVAPMLTTHECDSLIQRSHEAAKQNLKQHPNSDEFTKSPKGWRKERHGSYPTTDLNLVTDPFTKEDRQYLAERLHARLAPLIHRIYGIAPSSIRANDMFVVRYDADEGQQALKPHTDEAHLSFNILLNDDFEGGGTRFFNRRSGEEIDVYPSKGYVLLSNAVIQHEGLPTTRGTRYILVGFLSLDRTHIFTGMGTGLSLFASWLSMPWTQVQFKQGSQAVVSRQRQEKARTKWTDNYFFHQSYKGIGRLLEYVGDAWAPHKAYTLVHVDNVTKYLDALDAGPLLPGRAIWFQGQRLVTDIDGTIVERVSTYHDPREL